MFNVSSLGQIGSDNHISNYLADNSFVPSDVPVGTGCAPLAAGSHIKLADGGTRLVHPWEGQRLGPKLLG